MSVGWLRYFPAIYPDELLYSVVARHHRHTAADRPQRTLADLFGRRGVRLTPFRVGHLAALASRLPPDRDLTAERLALTATLYPYCIAYEPAPLRRAVLKALIHHAPERSLASWDSVTNPLYFVQTLRVCRSCAVEAMERFGETYWRRAHQLPGVLVCPDHGIPLSASSPLLSAAGRQPLVPAPLPSDPDDASPPAWASDSACVALLQDIARRSRRLLEAPAPDTAPDIRLEAMARRGMTEGPRQVHQRLLGKAYTAFAHPIRSALKEVQGTGWLMAMTQAEALPIHPLHHVLFDLLLDSLPQQSRQPTRQATRARWRAAQRGQPALSREQLAKRLPMEHAWLEREDRAWLEVSAPRSEQRPARAGAIDWAAADQALATQICQTAIEMRSEKPPRRVTKHAIKVRLAKRNWIARWAGCLPETLRALDVVNETTRGYHKRLIAQVLIGLGPAAATATITQVRRLTGVFSASKELLEEVLAERVAIREPR